MTKKPPTKKQPKKRTAGVEVVTIEGAIHAVPLNNLHEDSRRFFPEGDVVQPFPRLRATLIVHIPKRRSSK